MYEHNALLVVFWVISLSVASNEVRMEESCHIGIHSVNHKAIANINFTTGVGCPSSFVERVDSSSIFRDTVGRSVFDGVGRNYRINILIWV